MTQHKGVIDAVNNIEVGEAETLSRDDKITIDELVLKRFGKFSNANESLKKIVFEALASAVEDAAGGQTGLKNGAQPLLDRNVLQLYKQQQSLFGKS